MQEKYEKIRRYIIPLYEICKSMLYNKIIKKKKNDFLDFLICY